MTPFGYTVLGFGSGVVGGTAEAIPAGSPVEYRDAAVTGYNQWLIFDPNDANKFVIGYKVPSVSNNILYAKVGTISGTSITFGAEQTLGGTDQAHYDNNAAFDPTTQGRFAFSYRGGSYGYCFACACTISGDTITTGTEVTIRSVWTNSNDIDWDPTNSGRFVVGMREAGGAGSDAYATACTVSGTTITVGSAASVETAGTPSPLCQNVNFDPNTDDKFAITYYHFHGSGTGSGGVTHICTLPSDGGTTITVGAGDYWQTGAYPMHEGNAAQYDPHNANKLVIVYCDDSASDVGKAMIGTVSGTSISWGSEQQFSPGACGSKVPVMSMDPNNANKMVVCYLDADNSDYLTAKIGTIDGTDITWGDANVVFEGDPRPWYNVEFDPNESGRFVVAYADDTDSDYGKAIVCQMGVD